MFRIARNLLSDHFRRTKPQSPIQDGKEIPNEDHEETNLNEQVVEWFPMMLRGLPENYREAMELFELHGVPQQEIADRLACLFLELSPEFNEAETN